MQLGLGLGKNEETSKIVVLLTVGVPDVGLQITLTNEDTYEEDLDKLIAGMKQMKAEVRREKSGLAVVKDVPDGIRRTQGRKPHGAGITG